MASTTSTSTPRRSARTRRVTGPRLRPAAARARGMGRPAGVQAPTVTRRIDAPRVAGAEFVVPSTPRAVESRATAPQVPATTVRVHPRADRRGAVRLTDRGLLAVLLVFGVLAVTASAVLVGSFLSVSNAPVQGAPASNSVVAAQPADTGH